MLLAPTKLHAQVIHVRAVDSVDIYVATDLTAFIELYSCQFASNNINRGGYRSDELTIVKLRSQFEIDKFFFELKIFMESINFDEFKDDESIAEAPYAVIFFYRGNFKHEMCICENNIIELNGIYAYDNTNFRKYIDSFVTK